MNELIEKLQKQFNLSPEQCQGVIKTVAGFVKEKFPMVGSAMDSLLENDDKTSAPKTDTAAHVTDTDVAQAVAGAAAPGDTLGDVADKAKGFFEGNKRDY